MIRGSLSGDSALSRAEVSIGNTSDRASKQQVVSSLWSGVMSLINHANQDYDLLDETNRAMVEPLPTRIQMQCFIKEKASMHSMT